MKYMYMQNKGLSACPLISGERNPPLCMTPWFECTYLHLQVFRGEYKHEAVAVKVFRKRYNNQVLLHRYKDLREELTIMSNLDHSRVASLVGVCLKPLCIVLKLAPQGSLKDHIALCPQGMQNIVAHRLLFQVIIRLIINGTVNGKPQCIYRSLRILFNTTVCLGQEAPTIIPTRSNLN